MMLLGQAEGQAPNPVFPYADIMLQGGALAVLTWAVWHAYNNLVPALRKEIQDDRAQYMALLTKSQESFQKTLDVMADRHERTQQATADRFDRWEALRHADSEKLETSLTSLSVNCAEARNGRTLQPKPTV